MASWSKHFSNLLGKPPILPKDKLLPKITISDTLDIPSTPFTIEEHKIDLRFLKTNKAFGPDKIPAIACDLRSFNFFCV